MRTPMPRTSGVRRTLVCPHLSAIRYSLSRVVQNTFCYLPSIACASVLLITQMTAVTNAQSGTATLNGIVMDQHGAVVPGAQVAVISISQGFQRNVMTSGEGTFVVPLLPPGKY